ncbi:MAG: lysophospholipase [Planctomycetaceae bacterium]
MSETIESAELTGITDEPPSALRNFAASDGYEVAYRLWRPAGTPRALVVALHGIQSHSGWYCHSSLRLAEAGYAVAFLDRRGSGRNETARGDTPHADRLVADVVQFVGHLKRDGLDRIPLVLMAISWGGKLAATVAARRADLFDGLVLLAPGLCPQVGANAVQRLALKLGSAAGAGLREVSIPLDDPALFTDVPEYQSFIRNDPLALRRVTIRFLLASLDIDRYVQRNVSAIRCPILLMLAGQDRIIDNDATRRLVVSFGSTEKTLLEYPDACHTLEFERDRHHFIADLVDWLDHATVQRSR